MLYEREGRLQIDIEAVEKSAEILGDIIVQKWLKDASDKANADILRETGNHEDFVWQNLQKDMELKS